MFIIYYKLTECVCLFPQNFSSGATKDLVQLFRETQFPSDIEIEKIDVDAENQGALVVLSRSVSGITAIISKMSTFFLSVIVKHNRETLTVKKQ